ncbi:hypothetical protein [Brevibacterium permense]|uniref:Uncharacterized protein n=1 Tax=Brevibacterium permense TaxID=234834 RepID=A0ABN2AR65_9MICO|nr:hypothetical protein [Brevibacterium permense]
MCSPAWASAHGGCAWSAPSSTESSEVWHDIGQFFVPGAAGTLLRDLSYFPDAPSALQWWVLSAWLVVGIALILVGHVIAHRKAHAAAH